MNDPSARPALPSLLAASLVLAAAVAGGFLTAGHASATGFAIIGLASVAFALLCRTPVGAAVGSADPAPSPAGAGRPLALGLGASAALDGAGLVGWAQGGDPNLAWALFAAGLAGLLATAWVLAGRPRPGRPGAESVVVLGLVLLAAGLRFYGLDQQPFGLWKDEARNGLGIAALLADPTYRPLYAYDEPTLFWYLSAPVVLIGGLSQFTLRAPAALAGTLGVLAVYLLAREIGSRRYAFAAAALLAGMVWHLNFSRIAYNVPWSVALDALATFWFLRTLRRGSAADGLLGGLCLGLALQMYYTSRLLPLILSLVFLHRWLTARRTLPPLGAPLLAFVVAAALAASPLVLFAALNPAEFGARAGSVTALRQVRGLADLAPLWPNLEKHLLMFNVAGDPDPQHNLPGVPMLDPVSGALFLVGFLFCLPRLNRTAAFLRVIWVPIMLIGGVLTTAPPHALRTIDAVTGVALLAAVPLASLWDRWQALLAGRSRPLSLLPAAAAVAVLGWIGSFNVDRYFNLTARNFDVITAYSAGETVIGRELALLPPTTPNRIDRAFADDETIRFFAPRAATFHPLDPNAPLPAFEPGTAVFVSPKSRRLLADLRRAYPGVQLIEHWAPYRAGLLVYSARLPEDAAARTR